MLYLPTPGFSETSKISFFFYFDTVTPFACFEKGKTSLLYIAGPGDLFDIVITPNTSRKSSVLIDFGNLGSFYLT